MGLSRDHVGRNRRERKGSEPKYQRKEAGGRLLEPWRGREEYARPEATGVTIIPPSTAQPSGLSCRTDGLLQVSPSPSNFEGTLSKAKYKTPNGPTPTPLEVEPSDPLLVFTGQDDEHVMPAKGDSSGKPSFGHLMGLLWSGDREAASDTVL